MGSNPQYYNEFLQVIKPSQEFPNTLSANGNFFDFKKSVKFTVDVNLTNSSQYVLYSFKVDIEDLDESNVVSFKSTNITYDFVPKQTPNIMTLNLTTIGLTDSDADIYYDFVNLQSYKISYTAVIKDLSNSDVNTNKYTLYHIQSFTYYTNPVTLTNFTFNGDIGVGDDISISGLLLDHGANYDPSGNLVDTTYPEAPDAIEFNFQEAELSSSESNNEYNDPFVYYTSYEPSGNYTIQDNSLTLGKAFKIDAIFRWALGYSTFKRSDDVLSVLERPVIDYVSNRILYVQNSNDIVIDIGVEQLNSSQSVTSIWFDFYDASGVNVAIGGDVTTGLSFVDTDPVNTYSLKLSDISIVGATNGLENDVAYTVKARIKYASNVVKTSDPVNVSFNLVRPVMDSITAYDVQNDGNTNDSSTQIVATMTVNKGEYELYAPNGPSGIKFNIYDASGVTLLATTDSYTFVNNSSDDTYNYNIQLDEINLESGQSDLVNGTLYKVKVEVTLVDHSGDTETRESVAFTNMTFSQDVAPVIDLNISNTWALATDDNPSSSSARFNASPLIGISGYFTKNAQFNSGYTKHLDTTDTKFKLEYSLDSSSNWISVKKAVLIQKLSSESMAEAVDRARGLSLVSSTNGDGKYDNVPGSGVGTSQEEMVFYIPQEQETGVDAFTEYNVVQVRVTVIDTAELWDGSYEASIDSNTLQLINKIADYAFVVGDLTEPYNTQDISGNLSLNIPVSWASIYGNSVIVKHGYSSGSLNNTDNFNYTGQTYVTISVNPNSGTTLYYTVQYVVDNINLGLSQTTAGLTSAEQNVPNKFFPEDSDYSITSSSYNTFNTDGESSIEFTLSVSAASTNRIDGVNVYFDSPDSAEGSDIAPVRIGTYLFSDTGSKTIRLLYDPTVNPSPTNNSSTLNFTPLNYMDESGSIVTSLSIIWEDFDLANISFKAYRDRRVISYDASYNTLDYVESGVDTTSFNPVWNVPVLNSPSNNGSIILEGGVRNSSAVTKLSWQQTDNANEINFTYDLTMQEDSNPTLIHDVTDISGNNYDLDIDLGTNAQYIVTLRTVFSPSTTGAIREVSDPVDTITFYTIHVDVSGVNIQVQDPSNLEKVNLSWNEPVVTGDSVTLSGSESSSFDINIDSHYIKYLLTSDPSNNLIRLDQDPSGNLIERIISPATKIEYDLPVQSLGTTYQFYMYIEALIRYKVNSTIYDTDPVEISDQTTTSSDSQYIVSSIPSIDLPSTTPVLITGQSNPTLLLNLNANGLEDEGFISVVVILTQDGTADKPEGEQALLVFPDTGSTFNYNNTLGGSGAGGSDPRLAGGDSATSAPRNVTNASMSTQNNTYTLTIGTVGEDGRYGYSTLNMPSSADSGFVSSGSPSSASYNPINYMVILTTRRGTDIKVGMFEYQSLPAVQNVTITTSGGQYYVNFDISSV